MMLKHVLLSLLSVIIATTSLWAQPCDTNEVTITVSILTDDYPQELSWDIVGIDGTQYAFINLDATFEDEQQYDWEVCLPKGACSKFTIYDSFGDGLGGDAYYALAIDGVEIVRNTDFSGAEASEFINCPPGSACNSAIDIGLGEYLAPEDNTWYRFVPAETGQYVVTTCSLSICDTKIWIFDNCTNAHNGEQNEGTVAFDDNFGNCGEQANVRIGMEVGVIYYIRIGDDLDACANDSLKWAIRFEGPIQGCTDPNSCNYNPLAAIDDNSCIPFGDPACPNAPDLVISQEILTTSAYLTQIQSTDACLVEEGCLQGYGVRDVIRFSTNIANIGDADYFIGVPGPTNAQFTFDNCHGHWHYDGYAEYILFDELGQEIPIGFKNGFCVLDLGCTTGTAQYGCANMGITAGCYDEYWADLECQWIDITDVPDGRYTFVTRVNWDNAPDALGRIETDTLNNWAQMCIVLSRTSGNLQFSQDDDCDPYVDCKGVPYGSAQMDCKGDCNGIAKYGDLNGDTLQTLTDVEAYTTGIVEQNLAVTDCADLSANGSITVYDAALLSSCAIYGEEHPHVNTGPHDHCRFPRNVLNTNNFTGLSILDYDLSNQYFDIGIRSPSANIVAYQFVMSGLSITSVENLVDPSVFPITPMLGADSIVVGLSTLDSVIYRSDEWQPLVRVFHDGQLDQEICISTIIDIVNQDYERVMDYLEDACVTITSTGDIAAQIDLKVIPNPFDKVTTLSFDNPEQVEYELKISDIRGGLMQVISGIRGEEVRIEAEDWAKGIYLYELRSKEEVVFGKLLRD